jgi:subtilisin family serine protease
MNNEKIENLLNVSLSVSEDERERSAILDTGYSKEEKSWELIIRYSRNLEEVRALSEKIKVLELLGGFAVLITPESLVETIANLPSVIFVEMPKRLHFAVNLAKSASCATLVSQSGDLNLTGKGVFIGIVDSGIDISHPDFRNADGTTRIFRLWDQDAKEENPPYYYERGREYTDEELNELLLSKDNEKIRQLESTGHGTAVAGIVAGNGNASDKKYAGMAPESELLVVKLGIPDSDNFPRTTQLMIGVDYLVRQSIYFKKPIAINISFGMNYGSHSGQSLLESYLDLVSNMGQCSICVGSGNEGASPVHSMLQVEKSGEVYENEFVITTYQATFNMQIWKYYTDICRIVLRHPSGEQITLEPDQLETMRYRLGSVTLLIYYGRPLPYAQWQEIFIDFIPNGDFIDSGIWKIFLTPLRIVRGQYQFWLPASSSLNRGTGFVSPTPDYTLTIPSTALNVITVGAYDSIKDTYATFSGRGPTSFLPTNKPDLVAPGVSIYTTSNGGGYEKVTGTSFATPFVTGAAALLMQWGIVEGNDRFLYGQKLKAYLLKGAKQLAGYEKYPNDVVGWGKLCVRDSLPV